MIGWIFVNFMLDWIEQVCASATSFSKRIILIMNRLQDLLNVIEIDE